MECRKLTVKIFVFAACLIFSLIFSVMVYAADDECKVIYEGNVEEFVFVPESTDLFRNFKNVYPGDSINQKINISNNSDSDISVYLRAEAVDKEYCDFLDNMSLTISRYDGEVISYSKASEQGNLENNIFLGNFSSGEDITLNVTLDVDKLMDNSCQNMTGKVRWIFSAVESEESIIVPDDSDTIQTGDSRRDMVTAVIVMLGVSLSAAGAVIISGRKYRHNI